MNKNKYYLAVAIVGLLVTTAGVSAIVSADEGNGERAPRFNAERQENRQEQRDQMDEIFANKDFAAWQELMADKPFKSEMTEENFEKIIQIHELKQAGDEEGAKALAEELGLPGKKMEKRKGHMNKPEVMEAIESGDYSAWKELMGDRGPAQTITEENFGKFVEMHNLMVSGDKESAQALRDDLGLQDKERGFKKGLHSGERSGERNCQK
jgi:hypothetical protein